MRDEAAMATNDARAMRPVHFFNRFGPAENAPLAAALDELGVAHRIFGHGFETRYRRRIELMLIGWPRLAAASLPRAWRSLAASPAPGAVVVHNYFDVFALRLLAPFTGRRRPRIVISGFIHTPRRSPALEALRRAFFRFLFSLADCAVCHSRAESEEYARRFGKPASFFPAIPYGLGWTTPDASSPPGATPPAAPPVVFSAGRSQRDYATLIEAARDLPVRMRIACDSVEALPASALSANAEALRACFGEAFATELDRANIIVIPLASHDISAGQMVMLEAFARGKPVVASRTRTILEYAADGREALLVPPGDAAALRAAIARLLADGDLARRLGENARARFLERHTGKAFLRALVEAIARIDALPASGRA